MGTYILDAGNTRIKLFRWDGIHQAPRSAAPCPALLAEVETWPTPGVEGEWPRLGSRLAASCRDGGVQTLVVSSVVPGVNPWAEAAAPRTVFVDPALDFPFLNQVDDPAAVGADRYCNVAAAVGAGLPSALIVDVGTATTFDVLQDGAFLGGMIAPGPEFSLRKLAGQAPRLVEAPFAPSPLEARRNTRDAMASGAWQAGLGGINWCIEGLLRRHGAMPVLVTGGLGHHLQGPDRPCDPHLTLRGAAFLAGLFPAPGQGTGTAQAP